MVCIHVYEDLYDGKVWNEFQVYGRQSFLADPFSIAVIMNIDWFKPYKHLEYKVGAIYMTVMNLPRYLRYKQENCILISWTYTWPIRTFSQYQYIFTTTCPRAFKTLGWCRNEYTFIY